MNLSMRGHSDGDLCEICDTRPGIRLVRAMGMEAWACTICAPASYEDYERLKCADQGYRMRTIYREPLETE